MKKHFFLFLICFIFIANNFFAQSIRYVDASMPDNNGDGKSWATAKRDLQEFILYPWNVGEVWIKKGSYKPTEINLMGSFLFVNDPLYNNPRLKTFTLRDGVRIYGGFAGNETNKDQRNIAANPTILSGDIDGNPDNYCTNILTLQTFSENTTRTLVLDGLIFEKSNANIGVSGISPFTPVDFNLGGAIKVNNPLQTNSVEINNCTFRLNKATRAGGAIYFYGKNLTITNSVFNSNKCDTGTGGAIYYNAKLNSNFSKTAFLANQARSGGALAVNVSPYYTANYITNCIFRSNIAADSTGGGAILLENGSFESQNCTFFDNARSSYSGLGYSLSDKSHNQTSTGIYTKGWLFNCIVTGTNHEIRNGGFVVQYSAVQGGQAGTGNINTSGGFDGGSNDYGLQLHSTSPCINAGSPYINTPPTDFKGQPRVGRFDMGAYEFCNSVSIFAQPSSMADIVGATVQFTVLANGPNLTYQWKNGTTNVGTNSNILTLTNIAAADAGNYTCAVSNSCNTVTSSVATLTVNTTQKIYYVRSDGANSLAGTSWATAKRDLQSTINIANAGDMIWVKAGTYKPTMDPFANETPDNPRDKTFYLKSGIKIFGGFAGNETTLAQRNPTTNVTILNGDLDNNSPSVITDDVFHVLLSVKDNINTKFDGFTIQYGNATGGGNNVVIEGASVPQNFGGGMCNFTSWPTINNCIFKNCIAQNGGAIENTDISNPTISNCKFLNNAAKSTGGGAIANEINSDPQISNCIFNNNAADGAAVSSGGAVYVGNGGNCTTINCSFSNNTARFKGGAICVDGNSTTDITNSTFYNNTATSTTATGGAINYDATSTGKIINSILYGNTTPNNTTDAAREEVYCTYTGTGSNLLVSIKNSIVKDASGTPLAITNAALSNCKTDNPLFKNTSNLIGTDNTWATADDGLQLQNSSTAINAGDALLSTPYTDITGIARFLTNDIGAYESRCLPAANATIATANESLVQPIIGNTYLGYNCDKLIAYIQPDATSTAVSGSVYSRVWIETTQPESFVKRHYEITPQFNESTATGRVTLFFTNQEFADFNNQIPAPESLLPLSTDASATQNTRKANLLIEKRSGISNNGTGLPNTYTGNIQTINPADSDIIWNNTMNRWEVSFDVTGFSGFFVKTVTGTLPVKWLTVNGNLNTQKQAVINWKVQEHDVLKYEVEKSENGIIFTNIGVITGKGDGVNNYSFTDQQTVKDINYYRIKQLDNNGRNSYSVVIKLINNKTNEISIFPNPTNEYLNLNVSKNLINSKAIIYTITGQKVLEFLINNQSTTHNIKSLNKGTYVLQLANGTVKRIIKN